ncbi:MAG: anti-sigma factor antagonist [Solibacillus sp.]
MKYNLQLHRDTILVVRLFGELGHHEIEKVRANISQTILSGQVRFVIWNMEYVQFMDSSGIGLILGRMRELRAINGQMLILNPSETVQKIFQFAGLTSFVRYISEGEAIMQAGGIVNG